MNPITRVMSFFQEREVGIVSTFDDGQLDTTLERVERDLTRDPENATLAIDEQGAAISAMMCRARPWTPMRCAWRSRTTGSTPTAR